MCTAVFVPFVKEVFVSAAYGSSRRCFSIFFYVFFYSSFVLLWLMAVCLKKMWTFMAFFYDFSSSSFALLVICGRILKENVNFINKQTTMVFLDAAYDSTYVKYITFGISSVWISNGAKSSTFLEQNLISLKVNSQ